MSILPARRRQARVKWIANELKECRQAIYWLQTEFYWTPKISWYTQNVTKYVVIKYQLLKSSYKIRTMLTFTFVWNGHSRVSMNKHIFSFYIPILSCSLGSEKVSKSKLNFYTMEILAVKLMSYGENIHFYVPLKLEIRWHKA